MKPLFGQDDLDKEAAGSSDRREEDRLSLVLNARCQFGQKQLSEVWLIDVSTTGCQLFNRPGLFRTGQQVVISHWHDRGFRGEVVWATDMKAGVRFASALPGDAIEGLLGASPSLLPVRHNDVPVDQFGRELAPLPPLTDRKNAF